MWKFEVKMKRARSFDYERACFTSTTIENGIVDESEESGATPEDNALIKARFYGQYFDVVICNDFGLYFEG